MRNVFVLILLLTFAGVAVGQTAQPSGDAHELAKQLSNPVSSLISFPLQSNFDFGMGAGSGWRYTLNIQPVVPISLTPKWNMISRTIAPIIHQHNVAGLSDQSGLGDISQSLFFSPIDSKRFVWGVGPQLLIPTATNDLLGTEKFALGPTVIVLKQKEAWTYGAWRITCGQLPVTTRAQVSTRHSFNRFFPTTPETRGPIA